MLKPCPYILQVWTRISLNTTLFVRNIWLATGKIIPAGKWCSTKTAWLRQSGPVSVAPNDTKSDFLPCCSSTDPGDNLTRPPKTLRGSHAVDGLCRHGIFSYQLLDAATRDSTSPFPALQWEVHKGRGGWHRVHNSPCPLPFPCSRRGSGAAQTTAASYRVQSWAP